MDPHIDTPQQQQPAIKWPEARQRHLGHHLKLVQYLPSGGEPRVCAAIWRKGNYVHLASPLMKTRGGVRDPRPYVQQFPEGLASIDAFEETMTWLDAACYAAADPREVEAACQQHPEWQLRCIRYDGSDTTLLSLAGLIRAFKGTDPLPEPIMSNCLLELIKQILKNELELAGVQIDSTLHEGDDVATLDFSYDRQVLVTVRRNIVSTDVVRLGLLAHYQMTDKHKGLKQCLLVLPDMTIERPMPMTSRVVITDMDPEHLRESLVLMAKR